MSCCQHNVNPTDFVANNLAKETVISVWLAIQSKSL